MVVLKYIDNVILLCTIVNLDFSVAFYKDADYYGYKTSSASTNTKDSDNGEHDQKWLENALRDVAYYLRNYKFNEWDQRYYSKKPSQHFIGFYETFPNPSLKSVHWEVQENCQKDFFICITYLYRVAETAPFTRSDDITTSLNRPPFVTNITSFHNKNTECKKALLYTEKTGLPFGGPKEKFIWRTSASYYMCWYTMKGIPAMSMLGESCDNFANCLDKTYGYRNRDPRSDDKLSFACAMYSFCPDPCCPLKHIRTLSECYNSIINPCFVENVNNISFRQCYINKVDNQNLEQIIENKWNVSCHCQQKGFTWNSQFGMCIDINECTNKEHKCDMTTENCLNLPGTYQCVCKWGFSYNKTKQTCVKHNFVEVFEPLNNCSHLNFVEKITNSLKYVVRS